MPENQTLCEQAHGRAAFLKVLEPKHARADCPDPQDWTTHTTFFSDLDWS